MNEISDLIWSLGLLIMLGVCFWQISELRIRVKDLEKKLEKEEKQG